MVQTPVKIFTLQEFLELPETKPASEYDQGYSYQKPMPQGEHSVIQSELVAALNTALKPSARAFTELRCIFGEQVIVPDLAVFIQERIPLTQTGRIANRFELAPDWLIEILSPQQSQTRLTKKIVTSLAYGTQMGWLIDPQEQAVLVYTPDPPIQVIDRPADYLPTPTFAQNFVLSIETLFAWLTPS